MKTIPYRYQNCPVPGGGFVTGFLFHPTVPDVLYARTDIGGVYRYQQEEERWHCLIDHVTQEEQSECFPLSFAVDEADPNRLFIICGDQASGLLCISKDRGDTFQYRRVPCCVHGNNPGRATGERLWYQEGTLYFASQDAGLLYTTDLGETWEQLHVLTEAAKAGNIPASLEKDSHPLPCYFKDYPDNSLNFYPAEERNLTLFFKNGLSSQIPDAGNFLVVGTTGEGSQRDKTTRGCTLYISFDEGITFQELPCPAPLKDLRQTVSGFVPQRLACDGQFLYVTFTAVDSTIFGTFDCCSCDTGGCFDGRLYRYSIAPDHSIAWQDITPDVDITVTVSSNGIPTSVPFQDPDCPERKLQSGLGGVDARDGMLICATIGHKKNDIIYASLDQGTTWKILLCGLTQGKITFDVPYMKPEYNGGGSLIHWLSDLKINPHYPDMALFNTGTGVFKSKNLTQAKTDGIVEWCSFCQGIEETVHLNVYGIPEGEVLVLDIIGDLGGFAFTSLDTPPENSFADSNGNRYITCLNADFTDSDCRTIAATPRGNWTGRTKGGVIITHDQCKTWKRIPDPYGLSDELDHFLDKIQHPNVDSGWVAYSADGKRLVRCVQGNGIFPSNAVCYTDDEGEHWEKSRFYDLNGEDMETSPIYIHIYADRVNPELFYAVGKASRFFVSYDKAACFYELPLPATFPPDMFYRDRSFELRCERGREGILWIALGEAGLYRFHYESSKETLNVQRITGNGESSYCIGLGCPASGSSCRTLYTNGKIQGTYGFYRSNDYGQTWERINNETQMFGSIISIAGDDRVYGRFYLATGTKGLVYGVPEMLVE